MIEAGVGNCVELGSKAVDSIQKSLRSSFVNLFPVQGNKMALSISPSLLKPLFALLFAMFTSIMKKIKPKSGISRKILIFSSVETY